MAIVGSCERCGDVVSSMKQAAAVQRYGCRVCGCRDVQLMSRGQAEQLAYRQAFERMLAERGGECDVSEKIEVA